MEHSLKSDLARQSTEELDIILNYCLQQEQLSDYEHVIRLILEILWEREKDELEEKVSVFINYLSRDTEKLKRIEGMMEKQKLHYNEKTGDD